jgi:hypothetical protein
MSNKLLLILIGILLLILFGIVINGSINTNYKKIQTAILAGDEKAIKSLENVNINTANQIIAAKNVKLALVKFYLEKQKYPLLTYLDFYDESIQTEILKDVDVYQYIKNFYYQKINNSIIQDQFKNALSLLGTLKTIYPASDELLEKYQEIQTKKQQRLAALTQQYIECLDQSLAPLLERTHCMAEARTQIENVGIEHSLPIDANLPAMYAEEIRHALTEKNYYQAETLLLDWQKLLPAPSEQRDAQKAILILHRQLKTIIADLTGNDTIKIVKRLSQLNTDPILQQEILAMPQIQNNLLAFHLNEALILLSAKDNNIQIPPNLKEQLKEILNADEEEIGINDIALPLPMPITTPTPAPTSTSTSTITIEECQRLINKKHLTRGKNNALNCYKTILQKEPDNLQALNGLKKIEDLFILWAESALQRKQFSRVKSYIQTLEKINPDSWRIKHLKQRLSAEAANI